MTHTTEFHDLYDAIDYIVNPDFKYVIMKKYEFCS